MELCINTKLNLRGASANVEIYTISENISNETISTINDISLSELMNLVRRHRGCEIASDNLLTIKTCDNEVEVVVSPANLLARMGWGKAVSKVRRRREAEEERGA
jgi:hypothetical protein